MQTEKRVTTGVPTRIEPDKAPGGFVAHYYFDRVFEYERLLPAGISDGQLATMRALDIQAGVEARQRGVKCIVVVMYDGDDGSLYKINVIEEIEVIEQGLTETSYPRSIEPRLAPGGVVVRYYIDRQLAHEERLNSRAEAKKALDRESPALAQAMRDGKTVEMLIYDGDTGSFITGSGLRRNV